MSERVVRAFTPISGSGLEASCVMVLVEQTLRCCSGMMGMILIVLASDLAASK